MTVQERRSCLRYQLRHSLEALIYFQKHLDRWEHAIVEIVQEMAILNKEL